MLFCISYISLYSACVSLEVLKFSFIECPSVVRGNSNYDDISISVHGGLPGG